MSQSAHVQSIELLKRLKEALVRFRIDAEAALGTADSEVRRIEELLVDRLKHWQQQVQKRTELVLQARSALSHARALHRGESVGCTEQELALRKAQERLREAEGKVVIVRRWQRELPNALKDYEGPARRLLSFVEGELRQAIVLLDNKISTLEAYISVSARGESFPVTPPSSSASNVSPKKDSTEPEAKEP